MTELEARVLRIEQILELEYVDVPSDFVRTVRLADNLSMFCAVEKARRLRIDEEFEENMKEATK